MSAPAQGWPRPPGVAVALGAAGLIPFVWGLFALPGTDLGDWTARYLTPRLVAPYVQLAYGAVILAFMSGVLWGFATRTTGDGATRAYALSVLPALWAFLMVGGGAFAAAWNLIFGFALLLLLDAAFQRWRLAPDWWLTLRVPLTGGVILCLFLGTLL